MTCDRHAYYKRNPRGLANEYVVRVLPEDADPPEPTPRHHSTPTTKTHPWRRITANDARHEAAWEHKHGPDYIRVEKCPVCFGAGTLENDAERHPNGTLAQRLSMAGPAPLEDA